MENKFYDQIKNIGILMHGFIKFKKLITVWERGTNHVPKKFNFGFY